MGMVTVIRTALVFLTALAVVPAVFVHYDKIAIKINKKVLFWYTISDLWSPRQFDLML